MRRLILRVHLATALIAGAFILVLGVTGSALAFEPDLDRLLHARLPYVKPSGRVLSLSEIGDAVSRQFNAAPIVAYLPSRSAGIRFWDLRTNFICDSHRAMSAET